MPGDSLLIRGNEKIERDLAYLVRMTSMIMLVVLAISWRIYIPGFRIFAEAPLVQGLRILSPAMDYIAFFICIISLIGLSIVPVQRLAAIMLALSNLFMTLQDISRLQPYIMMYCFTIVVAVFWRSAVGLDALRIMVCGVYFWAGFHKLNATFLGSLFPWFIAPLHTFSKPFTALDMAFSVGGVIAPLFEAAIGILLLFPKWRKRATGMAFFMMIMVLACLGPLGHNWAMVVWPWNVYLFLMELQLFFNSDWRVPLKLDAMPAIVTISIVLFVLAPAMAMLTPWYSPPGFKLYSGNNATAVVLLSPEEKLTKAPDSIKKSMRRNFMLPLVEWSVLDLGTGLYPVPYVFKTGAVGLCPYLDKPALAVLRMYEAPVFYSLRKEHKDVPLCR